MTDIHGHPRPPDLTVRRVLRRYWTAFYRKTFTTELRCGCRWDHRRKRITAFSVRCVFDYPGVKR